MGLTESVKTKLAIITMIGPRLTDPKQKSEEIISVFRYSEEKKQAEEVHIICHESFNNEYDNNITFLYIYNRF